jgi:hypothetical protein
VTEELLPLFHIHRGRLGDDDLAALTVVLCALSSERDAVVQQHTPAVWTTPDFRAAHSWQAGRREQPNPPS